MTGSLGGTGTTRFFFIIKIISFFGGDHRVRPLISEDGTPSHQNTSPMASPQGIMESPYQKPPPVPLPRL